MAGQIVNTPSTGTAISPVGVLYVNTTSATTATTGDEILSTYTLPANTLSTNGQAIRITVHGITAANANTKTIRIRLNGTAGTAIAGATTSATSTLWTIVAILFRTGAATQAGHGNITFATGSAGAVTGATVNSTPTATLSDANTIDVVVSTPTAAGDATFKTMLVEALN